MTVNTSDLTKLYSEFAQRTAKKTLSSEDVQTIAMALRRPENTPESLSKAYFSFQQCAQSLSTSDSETLIDLFAIGLSNPQNNKDSFGQAAASLSHVSEAQTEESIGNFAHALHSYVDKNQNPSEALSNTYDFLYDFSKISANAYNKALKHIASFINHPQNDAKSVNHALEGLAKSLPQTESSISLTFSSGFLEVAQSCLNNPNVFMSTATKTIVSNLPKMGNRSQTKALNMLNETVEKNNSSKNYSLITTLNTYQFPENYPEQSLKLAQTALNKKDTNDETLGAISSGISQIVQKKPEFTEVVPDIYKQMMDHPSCNVETLETIYMDLSTMIKAQPSKATTLLDTYKATMQHPMNDSESLENAQKRLSHISQSYSSVAQLKLSQQERR